MGKWIELHRLSDDGEILLNVDRIRYIEESKGTKYESDGSYNLYHPCTEIVFDVDDCVKVRETYMQVYNKMYSDLFI